MRNGIVQFGQQRLAFRYRSGVGTPVVFFHGTTGTSQGWDEVIARLASVRPLYCIDARGHGASGRSASGDYRIEAHVEDLTAFLESVTGPAVVVGHSLGGAVGFHTAGLRPDLVTALYSEDITPYFVATRERYESAPLVALLKDIADLVGVALVGHHSADWLTDRMATLGPAGMTLGELMPRSFMTEWADGLMQMDPRAVASQLAQPVSFDIDAALGRITGPIHVAHGDEALGSLVTPDDLARLSGGRPRVTSTHFPGAGHSIRAFHPHAYVDDLAVFLSGSP